MSSISEVQKSRVIDKLIDMHGDAQGPRIEKGVRQVAALWRKQDGTFNDFAAFCTENYIADAGKLREFVDRFEKNLESLNGHFHEITRDFNEPLQLDMGPPLAVDYMFANYTPWAHVDEDFFKLKIAFAALLNLPEYSLEQKLSLGPDWSRDQWARARLVENFTSRVPAEVSQKLNEAYVTTDNYIANYNIYMHHVLDAQGRRLFPKGLKLITHWGLRDELKAQYANSDGLARQKMIYEIMENIIRQTIPEQVIDNPAVDWHLPDNRVTVSAVPEDGVTAPETVSGAREPDTRYRMFLNIVHAEKMADPYYPTLPTKMDRAFQRDREIPEEKVIALFESLLLSDQFRRTGRLIAERLGRDLQPFDIWYDGFKSRTGYNEAELDRIVQRQYKTAADFDNQIDDILLKLGFSPKQAAFYASKIDVDPSRGAGHAMGAARRADNAHLRTRVPENGMNYKGYNIACHELGHCVEQVTSLNLIDHTLLNGVPNTAFTEAFAFVFQARDLELLGLKKHDPMETHLAALDNLWATCEIAGVSLVDMKVWHWLYDNPGAGPEELKNAVLQISKDVWNTYFAPVFGEKDAIILGIYSHMIDYGLYLPDYPLGHIIAFQIEDYLKGKVLGKEMIRMCSLGTITPEAWMQAAVGESISTEPMLKASEKALTVVK